jgi:hypothetical protein
LGIARIVETMSDRLPPVSRESQPGTRPVALVTGSARRLGREIALDLAAHGFDIAVHYRGEAQEALETVSELLSLGAGAHAFHADLSIESACRELLPQVVAHFGRVDAVINNAAMFEYDTPATFSHAAMDLPGDTVPAVLLAQALHDHHRDHLAAIDPPACVVG